MMIHFLKIKKREKKEKKESFGESFGDELAYARTLCAWDRHRFGRPCPHKERAGIASSSPEQQRIKTLQERKKLLKKNKDNSN